MNATTIAQTLASVGVITMVVIIVLAIRRLSLAARQQADALTRIASAVERGAPAPLPTIDRVPSGPPATP